MNRMPFIEPANSLALNSCAILIILEQLSNTSRGKQILNIEKLQVFYFLILRPTIMNQVLRQANKKEFVLRQDQFFSVNSISSNIDPLHSRNALKAILRDLGNKGFIDYEYQKTEGFTFKLSEAGQNLSELISGNYFDDVRHLAKHLKQLQSQSINKLNSYINNIFRKAA